MANFPFISFFQMCKQATSVEPEHRAELVLLVPIKWCLLRCHISGICPMARDVLLRDYLMKERRLAVWNLTPLPIILQLAHSLSQSIKLIALWVKWKAKWVSPSSRPLACSLAVDVIDMEEKSNGIVATAVISRAKWARVGPVCLCWSALDQKDSFQQPAAARQHWSVARAICLPLSLPLSLSPADEHKIEQTQWHDW